MIHIESQPRIVADIVMLTASEGGRSRGLEVDVELRYMPHLVIDDRANRVAKTDMNNQSIEHYMGVLFGPALSISDAATGSGRYQLRLMYHPRVDYTTLKTNATFTIREGGRVVGHGIVISSGGESNFPQP